MTQSAFAPTHSAPVGGLTAWAGPDPASSPVAHIEARVELRVLGYWGVWAHVECSNGWQAWVDARALAPADTAPAARPRSSINPVITRIGGYAITLADLLPAVGIVLGALVPWLRGGLGKGTSFDTPLLFLFDTTPDPTGAKLGVVLAVAAFLAVATPLRAGRALAYAVALAVSVLYAVQLSRLLHQTGASVGIGSTLGVGVYICGAAAVVGLAWTLAPRSGNP